MGRRHSTCQHAWLRIPQDSTSIDEFNTAKLIASLTEQFRHVVFDVGAQESLHQPKLGATNSSPILSTRAIRLENGRWKCSDINRLLLGDIGGGQLRYYNFSWDLYSGRSTYLYTPPQENGSIN